MTARTITEYRALAKTTKCLAHLAARRNTGTWVSRCGRQIRGQQILEWQGEAAGVQAVTLGDDFCEECRAEAIRTAGTIADGVAILLNLDPADDSAPQLLEVPVDSITADGPGRDPGKELIVSVHENGVVTPIVARRTDSGLRLVSGSRRLAAARAAGLTTVPTIIIGADEHRTAVDRLLENLHREDLDPIAQACAYVEALGVLEVTHEALADGLGVSRPRVSNTIRLLELPNHLKAHAAAGRITAAHGRALLRLNGHPEAQDELADEILAGMTTKDAEAAARRAAAPVPGVPMADVAQLLSQLLDAKVRVTASAERSRFVIDVPIGEANRILVVLGAPAVA